MLSKRLNEEIQQDELPRVAMVMMKMMFVCVCVCVCRAQRTQNIENGKKILVWQNTDCEWQV